MGEQSLYAAVFVLTAYGAGAVVLGGGAIELPAAITWQWIKPFGSLFIGQRNYGPDCRPGGVFAVNIIWRISVARRWVRRRERAK